MSSHFFAMLSRMKYINRWGLMRNTRAENLSEHSLDTAFIAHCLCVLRNARFGGNIDPNKAAVVALFHDTPEIITGDLPTPVKYFNPEIKTAYKKVEKASSEKMLSLLPEDLKDAYLPLLSENDDAEIHKIVKAADKLSALIKCIEERRLGNPEFKSAEEATLKALEALDLPEVKCFMAEFLPSFSLSLDELQY